MIRSAASSPVRDSRNIALSRPMTPPPPRDLDIFRLRYVEHYSLRLLADRFELSPTRIRQICYRVRLWLTAVLPPMDDKSLAKQTHLAQHLVAEQLQDQVAYLSELWDGTHDLKCLRLKAQVLMMLARLAVPPGLIEGLLAEAAEPGEASPTEPSSEGELAGQAAALAAEEHAGEDIAGEDIPGAEVVGGEVDRDATPVGPAESWVGDASSDEEPVPLHAVPPDPDGWDTWDDGQAGQTSHTAACPGSFEETPRCGHANLAPWQEATWHEGRETPAPSALRDTTPSLAGALPAKPPSEDTVAPAADHRLIPGAGPTLAKMPPAEPDRSGIPGCSHAAAQGTGAAASPLKGACAPDAVSTHVAAASLRGDNVVSDGRSRPYECIVAGGVWLHAPDDDACTPSRPGLAGHG